MRYPSPLLIAIIFSKESFQITSNTCYFPDGTLAANDRPCFPDKASSQCCAVGHSCMSNNLCRWPDVQMPYPLVYIRGSCTDKTWASPDCTQQCQNDFPSEWDEIYACSNGHFCCDLPGVNGDGCCNATAASLFDLAPGTTATVISAASWGTSIISGNAATTSAAQETSIPSLVLETISYGPPTTAPTYSPIPSYTGSGSLLQGYCNTPNYILLDGPTAYWAPIVGCNDDKVGCCPYSVAKQTDTTAGIGTTVTVVRTVTVDVGPGSTIQSVYTGLNAYPVAISADQASLQRCPDDYQTVSGGCCPTGYQLWNAVLGGQVPCYSSLDHFLSPPAVPISGYQTPISIPLTALTSTTSSTSSGKPTSAVVNVVYAIQYPLASSQGLSTGAKAGIGAGAGIGALAIIGLVGVLIWRTKKHSRDKRAFAAAQAPAPGSTAGLGPISGPDSTVGQSQSFMSSVSPQQSAQTHNNFLPQETYFPPPQMQQLQQGFPPQKNYDQQPVQYIPQGWSQPNIQYSDVTRPIPQQMLQQQQIQYGQRQELHSNNQNNPRELSGGI